MAFRIAVVHNVDLDSRADGIAAYLRSFVKYAKGLHLTYWSESSSGETACNNQIVCKSLDRLGRIRRFLPVKDVPEH